jgi:hypothetical protein
MFGLYEEWDMLLAEAYLGRPLTEEEKERIQSPEQTHYYDNGDGRVRVEYYRRVKFPELHEDSITVVYQNKKRTYHYSSLGDSNQWKLDCIIEDELCTN